MNKEDIGNYISAEDIKEIATESGVTIQTVHKVLRGEVERSKCRKYILARIKKNKSINF